MPGAKPRKYQQRRRETTILYLVLQQHLESFLEHTHGSSGERQPRSVEDGWARRPGACGCSADEYRTPVVEQRALVHPRYASRVQNPVDLRWALWDHSNAMCCTLGAGIS
jgi:hypothetical protein